MDPGRRHGQSVSWANDFAIGILAWPMVRDGRMEKERLFRNADLGRIARDNGALSADGFLGELARALEKRGCAQADVFAPLRHGGTAG